jgi:histone H3/H4
MGYSGRNKSTKKVVVKKKVGVASSSKRDKRQKVQEEAREEAQRSESVNGYGRGLGSFLTEGQQQDTAPVTTWGGKEMASNEAGRGDDKHCANRNCSIGGGIANSTHKCPGCGKNIHAVCGEETENLHFVLCPHCKPGTPLAEGGGKRDLFASSDSDTDSDEEEEENEAKAVTRGTQGKQAGGKQLPTRSVGKTPKGKGKQRLSADQQKKSKAAARKKTEKKDAANNGKGKRKRKRKSDAIPIKKTKYKNGDRALMEIRKYQKDTELLVAKRPFSKLVREITEQVIKDNAGTGSVLWQASAVLAVHTAAKDYIVKVFEAAQLNAFIVSNKPSCQRTCSCLSVREKKFDDSKI